MASDFKKILFIKYGAISEIIASLAVINSIKKAYPSTEIHYFTEEIPANLLSYEENIDKFFSIRNISFKEFFQTAKNLKNENFDLIIDLSGSVKSYILSLLIGAKQIITTEGNKNISPLESFFKTVSEKIENLETEEYPKLTVPQKIQDAVQTAIPSERDFVIISTQTAQSTEGRKLRLEKFKELAIEIVKKYNVDVYFTGTADERKQLSFFENISPNIYNFGGRFNIIESAAFFKKAKCVIGIDSAPIYIAKSLRIPTIGLFGATSADCTGFSGENTYVIKSKKLACIPCRKKLCRLRNEEYSPCMDDISIKNIIDLIDEHNMLPTKI